MEKRDRESPAYRRRLLRHLDSEIGRLQHLQEKLAGTRTEPPMGVTEFLRDQLIPFYQSGIQDLVHSLFNE